MSNTSLSPNENSIQTDQLQHVDQRGKDKLHDRSKGPHHILTRAPIEGSGILCGCRINEVERNVIVQYGAAYFLRERHFDNPNAYISYYCIKCGYKGFEYSHTCSN